MGIPVPKLAARFGESSAAQQQIPSVSDPVVFPGQDGYGVSSSIRSIIASPFAPNLLDPNPGIARVYPAHLESQEPPLRDMTASERVSSGLEGVAKLVVGVPLTIVAFIGSIVLQCTFGLTAEIQGDDTGLAGSVAAWGWEKLAEIFKWTEAGGSALGDALRGETPQVDVAVQV